MNKCVLTGNLTKAPELRHTEGGTAICRFTIAINKYVKGEKKTTFINIVTFNKTAENCERYLYKGSKVAVIGELEIRQYTDNEGNNRYMTEILANEVEFLSNKNQSPEGQNNQNEQGMYDNSTPSTKFGNFEIQDEDLPF